MMAQESYVSIKDLHAQGWTIAEIADEAGFILWDSETLLSLVGRRSGIR